MTRKKGIKKIVTIDGMCCDKCAKRAEKALSAVHNVVSADVRFKTGIGVVRSREEVSDDDIMEAVESVGFTVVSVETVLL